jgi:ABC-type protease/lipase transport system fused ATPase/permease subunit
VFYVHSNDVTQTQIENGTKVLQTQTECKYKFVHTELVQVSMILNGSAQEFWNWNKHNNQSIKNDPSKQNTCYVKCSKTALHFMQYGVLWNTQWGAIIVYIFFI